MPEDKPRAVCSKCGGPVKVYKIHITGSGRAVDRPEVANDMEIIGKMYENGKVRYPVLVCEKCGVVD